MEDALPVGHRLGPYRIVERVGQGGMASVYKAYHEAMDRYVAIKVLPRHLATNAEFIGRFRQEARTIARLEHAHILPVHDYGESQGQLYLVMRFNETGTLKERLAQGPLPLGEVDRILGQLADALDYAHGLGVVHRDLKPANVLLDDRSNVFLADFGIAKIVESEHQLTSTGALVGTPLYMSPEQAQGQPVDRRSDLYALGVILYEMITGRVPFSGESAFAIMLKHLHEDALPPSQLRPELAPAAEQVVLRALAKRPAERFASVAELLAAWRAARAADATPAHTAPGLAPGQTGSARAPGAGTGAGTAGWAQPAPTGHTPPPGGPPPPGGTPPPGSLTAHPANLPTLLEAPPRPRRASAVGPLGLGLGTLVGVCLLLSCLAAGAYALVNGMLALPGSTPTREPRATATRGPAGTATRAATPAPPTEPGADVFPTIDPGLFDRGVATEPTPEPDEPTPQPLAGEWRSWTAGNQIRTVLQVDDQPLTGGPGGLTFWQADGEVEWRLTPIDGLPGSDVNALLVDYETESLFVGTSGGLLEVGSDTLTIHDTWNGLDSSEVTALAFTSQGVLAGTRGSGQAGGGLRLLDRGSWRAVRGFPSTAEPQPDALSSDVTALLEDSGGVLWVGTTQGLGAFDGQGWARYGTEHGLPAGAVLALAESGGTLWAGTAAGLARFDGTAWVAVPEVPPAPVYGLVATSAGELWAGGPAGLSRLAAGGWSAVAVGDLTGQAFYGGAEGPDGLVVFGTNAGLARFDAGEVSTWVVPDTPAHNAFGRILTGPGGRSLVFVAERGSGADQYDLRRGQWQAETLLPCGECVPLGWDAEGVGYFGGPRGLWMVAGSQVTQVTTAQGLPSDQVNDVAFGPEGGYWIATPAGIAVYDGGAVTEVLNAASTGLATDEVRWLLPTSAGGLWALTAHGASLYAEGEWAHFGPGDPFRGQVRVTDMAEDAGGGVWLSTLGEGVYLYEDGNWTRFESLGRGVELPSDEVRCVEPAENGLWFCTDLGASFFTGSQWQVYDQAGALVDRSVNDIYLDGDGTVWFATSGGVTAYTPEE